MERTVDEAAFRARVRYAECNAHGELPLATYVNYFGEAAAQALRRVGLDLQALTARGGVLREGAIAVEVHESPAYDDEVLVVVGLDALRDTDFTLRLELRRQYRGDLLAQGSIRLAARPSAPHAMAELPPELRGALERLGT